MRHIWSYIIVVLCMTVTSSRIIDSQGNDHDLHDDFVSDVKLENLMAPPSRDTLNIDSGNLHGNSNGYEPETEAEDSRKLCESGDGRDSCPFRSTDFNNQIFAALLNGNYESIDYEVIPFDKEDFEFLQSSHL